MLKKIMGGLVLPVFFLMAGCATTGRNYQMDIDALNAKISALQGQLASKDQEIHSLQNQADELSLAREAAEAAARALENEKRLLSIQLGNAKAESHKTEAPISDLK